MVKIVKGALLAAVATFALTSVASAQGVLTDAEFKCQGKVSKAGSKFTASKAKCGSKCSRARRRFPPLNPSRTASPRTSGPRYSASPTPGGPRASSPGDQVV
jgi:hypothetical protein